MRLFRFTVTLLTALWLVACSTGGGVFPVKDSAPRDYVDARTIQDAVPREVVVTRAGNKNPYTVLGQTYHLLPTSEGYFEGGLASWYGTKFHGRPTANGETYSLYGMTAAHKTLPIPSYVKVTNLENERTAIVRVNDRGPFHQHRIIDLSYAAAVKLGFAEQGTAKVIVEAIDPKTFGKELREEMAGETTAKPTLGAASVAAAADRYFLQVAAFKNAESAEQLKARLLLDTQQQVLVRESLQDGFYRVQLGPFNTLQQVEQTSKRLQELNFEQPRLITETVAVNE